MRFRLLPLTAAMLLGAAGLPAIAQDSAISGLRGSVGEDDPLVLPAPPSDTDPATTASIPADQPDETGPVQRQTPQEKGPEPDPLETGSIPRRTITPEDDPFAALGIRAGGFILYPSLTTTLEHQTNGSGSGPATDLTVTPEFRLESDWARHAATLTLRGAYDHTLDGSGPDSPSGSIEATARLDLKERWDLAFDGRYDYSQQDVSDPNFPSGASDRPGVHDLFASATLHGAFGRGLIEVEGNIERTDYDDGTLSGGGIIDQSYRDNNLYGARLRLGYETPPGLNPFIEGEVSRRVFDQMADNNGLMRSSLTGFGRVGVMIDRGPVLTGEVAVGYGMQHLDDPTLASLSALTLDGSLVWSPVRLVTATFGASTSFNPTTDPASSGSVVHTASVDVEYAWKHNATVNWTASFTREAFQGTGQVDNTVDAGIAATWKLNRKLYLTGGYVHTWKQSTAASETYQSDAVRVELRLQR